MHRDRMRIEYLNQESAPLQGPTPDTHAHLYPALYKPNPVHVGGCMEWGTLCVLKL